MRLILIVLSSILALGWGIYAINGIKKQKAKDDK